MIFPPSMKCLPLLRQGWRAGVIGHMLDELLDGKLSIHIHDPLADEPLAFEQRVRP